MDLKWDNFHLLEDLNIFWNSELFSWLIGKSLIKLGKLANQGSKLYCNFIAWSETQNPNWLYYKRKKQPMSWNWACKWTHLYLRWSILKSRYLRNTTCTRAALILIKKTDFFFCKEQTKKQSGKKMCLEIYQKETKLCQITYTIEL